MPRFMSYYILKDLKVFHSHVAIFLTKVYSEYYNVSLTLFEK